MGTEGCSPFLSICCHQVENISLAPMAGKQEPGFRASQPLSLCFIHRESRMAGMRGRTKQNLHGLGKPLTQAHQGAPREAWSHGLVLSPMGSVQGGHPKPNPRAVPTPHSLTPFSPSSISHSSRGTSLQNKRGLITPEQHVYNKHIKDHFLMGTN